MNIIRIDDNSFYFLANDFKQGMNSQHSDTINHSQNFRKRVPSGENESRKFEFPEDESNDKSVWP